MRTPRSSTMPVRENYPIFKIMMASNQIISSYFTDNIAAFGLAAMELGSHSLRNGAVTFLVTIAGGPTAIASAPHLRAGWSLGVHWQNRYIKPLLQGDRGDQVVGG